MPLQVEIVSADHKVWSGEATMVIARTLDGELGILPGHAPLLAILAPGEVRVTPADGARVVADVPDGFLSVQQDRVTIVSDSAVLAGHAAATTTGPRTSH